MKKRKNNGFISKKIDSIFLKAWNAFLKTYLFCSLKVTEFIHLFYDAKEKSKDLIKTNLEVATEHIRNKNFFDAKIRYKIVLKIDDKNFIASSSLGYIYAKEGNLSKAKFYFNKSLECQITERERKEIEDILKKINQH